MAWDSNPFNNPKGKGGRTFLEKVLKRHWEMQGLFQLPRASCNSHVVLRDWRGRYLFMSFYSPWLHFFTHFIAFHGERVSLTGEKSETGETGKE